MKEIGEGVIKFRAAHRMVRLEAEEFATVASDLAGWRTILLRLALVGQDPSRYGGFAFGNLSARVGAGEAGVSPRFLITGSQVGGKEVLSLDEFCLVEACDPHGNRVTSYGLIQPSSESLTHDAVYRLDPKIGCVLHVHSPEIWKRRAELELPTTASNVSYGSPDMAREVGRLYDETALAELRILAMGGHEDGIVSFGAGGEEAGETLIRFLARSLIMSFSDEETP